MENRRCYRYNGQDQEGSRNIKKSITLSQPEFLLVLILTGMLALTLSSAAKGFNSKHGATQGYTVTTEKTHLDLSGWSVRGDMVIRTERNGTEQLVRCDHVAVSVLGPEDLPPENFQESYRHFQNSNGETELSSLYFERLKDGTCIAVSKWFTPCTEEEAERDFDIEITVTLSYYDKTVDPQVISTVAVP